MRELRDDEILESERPREVGGSHVRVLKSKVVIKDEYDPDDGELEIIKKRDGLQFKFTTRQERSVEKLVECDMGHKHRQVETVDFSYESIFLNRRHAKILLAWFAGEGEEYDV